MTNSSACQLCPGGFECPDQRSKSLCGSQSYRVAVAGQSGSCTLCPPNSQAAPNRLSCTCDTSYYMVLDPASTRADRLLCQTCPLGADCTLPGTTGAFWHT